MIILKTIAVPEENWFETSAETINAMNICFYRCSFGNRSNFDEFRRSWIVIHVVSQRFWKFCVDEKVMRNQGMY